VAQLVVRIDHHWRSGPANDPNAQPWTRCGYDQHGAYLRATRAARRDRRGAPSHSCSDSFCYQRHPERLYHRRGRALSNVRRRFYYDAELDLARSLQSFHGSRDVVGWLGCPPGDTLRRDDPGEFQERATAGRETAKFFIEDFFSCTADLDQELLPGATLSLPVGRDQRDFAGAERKRRRSLRWRDAGVHQSGRRRSYFADLLLFNSIASFERKDQEASAHKHDRLLCFSRSRHDQGHCERIQLEQRRYFRRAVLAVACAREHQQ